MDSRRDQLQVLEHFNQVLKADKARPQIAQLSELGLVELTRKRQGQNIYELFGRTCLTCNGLGHLVHLPGESEVSVGDVNSSVATRNIDVEQATRPAAVPPPTLVGVAQNSPWDTKQGYQEVENANNAPDLELLNHPSYQETRRRRRRRVGINETIQDETLELEERELGSGMEYPILSEGYSLTTSNRRDRREIIRPITETPEVVTVEMTSDEQDVYALMGISPLTLLEEGIVKNSKSIIISVRQPGEGENHLSSTTLKKEEVELESVVNDHESDDDDRELDDFNSSVSFDKGDDFDVGEENYHYDLELSDLDVDLNSDSNDSDDSGPIRRRRRRSSAVTVED